MGEFWVFSSFSYTLQGSRQFKEWPAKSVGEREDRTAAY